MMSEREKRESLSPFQRMTELFNKLPEQPNPELDQRYMQLGDGKVVYISKESISHGYPVSGYRVDIYFTTVPTDPDECFSFMINTAGSLKHIGLPNLQVKVGGVKVGGEIVILAEPRNDYRRVLIPDREAIVAANTLVDWLDTVIKEKKYTKPPISAFIFR